MRRAVLLAVLLSAVATGCGASDEVGRRVDPVASAADKTLASGGAKMTGQALYKAQGFKVPMTITGEIDFQHQATSFQMDMGHIRGVSRADLEEARKEAGFPARLMQFPHAVYINAELLPKELPTDAEWAKLDLDELSETLPGLDLLSGANESNPVEMLRFLRAAGDAKKIGPATVRGTRTTEYRAHVDLHKAVELAAPDEREEFRKTIERVGKSQGFEFDAAVFIGRDGLIRRERITFDDELDGEPANGSVVLDLHDFGDDIDVQAPPDDDVEDITPIIKDALD